MLRAYLRGYPEVCLCCIGTKVCHEVTCPPAGLQGTYFLGVLCFEVVGAGVGRAAGYRLSWCASKDIYFFTLTEAPGLSTLERFLKG